VFAVALGSAALAGAGTNGAGTQTLTVHAHNVILQSGPSADPCNPSDTGTLTITSVNEVFHITTQADGSQWMTQTDEGTISFVPDNPADASGSGHFTSWFGAEINNPGVQGVFHDTGTDIVHASDGSLIKLHMLDHTTFNGQGIPTATFSVSSLSCIK
jgi:hypothetical protein